MHVYAIERNNKITAKGIMRIRGLVCRSVSTHYRVSPNKKQREDASCVAKSRREKANNPTIHPTRLGALTYMVDDGGSPAWCTEYAVFATRPPRNSGRRCWSVRAGGPGADDISKAPRGARETEHVRVTRLGRRFVVDRASYAPPPEPRVPQELRGHGCWPWVAYKRRNRDATRRLLP